jgi:ElaA protein
MKNELTWTFKAFKDLTPYELYNIHWLRNEVFVVEQNCVFQDADYKDQYCDHLSGYINDKLAAYARIVPPGVSYEQPSIGRIVTAPAFRGGGSGRALLTKSIAICEDLYEGQPIRIGAQLYLKKFYESFGFKQSSEMYLEDGIEHIEMMRVVP